MPCGLPVLVHRKKGHEFFVPDGAHKVIDIIELFIGVGIAVFAVYAANRFDGIFVCLDRLYRDVGVKDLNIGIGLRRAESDLIEYIHAHEQALALLSNVRGTQLSVQLEV